MMMMIVSSSRFLLLNW